MTPLASIGRRWTRLAVLLLWLPASLAACTSAPTRTIPDPLPETLEWALPPVQAAAFLGLEVRENDSGTLESLSFDPGVRVHEVVDSSPAAAAGIRVDDVILEFDGVELAVPDDLSALLGRVGSGGQDRRVPLKAQRGDTVFDVEVPLRAARAGADAPTVEEAFVLDTARTLGAWGTGDGAVLVARAEKGPVGRLPLGTRVVTLDGDPIVSGRGLVRRLVALDPGGKVSLEIIKPGSTKTRRVRVRLLDDGRRTTRVSVPVLATYDREPDGSRTSFVLLDLYLISLFRYARDGGEKRWSFLRFFQFSSGVGELDE